MASSLEIWIRRVCWSGSPPTKFIVKHLPIGSKQGSTVHELAVPQVPEESWSRDAAIMIESVMEDDANGIGGVQSYVVNAMGPDDKPITRKTIRVSSRDDETEEGTPSEPANKVGLLAQTQRHLEAVMKTSSVSQQATMNAMNRMIEGQAAQIEKLLAEKHEMFSLYEELMSQSHERKLAVFREESRAAHIDKAGEMLKPLVPVIAAKLSGQKMLSDGKQINAVKALKDSLTVEQVSDIAGRLKPAQQTLLLELINSVE